MHSSVLILWGSEIRFISTITSGLLVTQLSANLDSQILSVQSFSTCTYGLLSVELKACE